jgi:4-hydroxy-2-oxoglutarate aldolase
MSQLNLRGIFPPIPTPFIKGNVAYDKLVFNVKKWNKTGIRGFVVLGSNGEYVYLSEEEKRKIVKTVIKKAAKGKLIIAGTGCESTRETIKLTKDCAQLGVDLALVVTPYYYGSKMNTKVLINHYTTIADNSPIPILLYNVPKFTHINLGVDIISMLSKHPNIIGIKDSSGNVNQLGEYLNNVDKNFNILVGTAGALLGALILGCSGGVLALANIAPNSCVKIFNLVLENKFEEARELQLKMIPINKAITATYGISGLKAALDILDYFGGEPKLPLLPATEAEKKEIRKILKKAELIK